MLRSRKKQLESGSKKPNDAEQRHLTPDSDKTQENKQADEPQKAVPRPDVPAIESLSEETFSPDVIDPSKIRKANQVDKWANMIDTMNLGGRIRQLAIHATIDEGSTDDLLILKLDQATKHLNSDAAHKQLELSISQYLARSIQVEVNIVDQTSDDPYQIQSQINDKRLEYAKDIIAEDTIVRALQDNFQAEVDQTSILPL